MGLDPASLAVSASMSGLQAAWGVIETIKAAKDEKKYAKMRTAYKMPAEFGKILNATMNQQGGYNPVTLNYLTNQTDQAFDQSTGALLRLGGNPNQLSASFNQKVDEIMKIGASNQEIAMRQTDKLLSAYQLIISGKDAEWQDKENKVKDLQRAAAERKKEGIQNIFNAANSFMSTQASKATGDLYTDQATKDAFKGVGADVGINTDWLMHNNTYARRF